MTQKGNDQHHPSIVGILRDRKIANKISDEDLKIKVKNHNDIIRATQPFMPNSEATIKKLLMDGIEFIKKFKIYQDASKEDAEYHGFNPAINNNDIDNIHTWVDTLIERRLDGKRVGVEIHWNLKDGKFKFDPATGAIDRVT